MNNIKKLMQVIEDHREEIIEMSKDLYKNTMTSPCQGWRVGIIADVNENIYDFFWSSGTSNTDLYGGKAVKVIDWNIKSEIGEIFYNDYDLTDDEQEQFKKFLIENEYIGKEDIEDCWTNKLNYDTLNEFNEDIRKRIDDEYVELMVDEYYREAAEEAIEETLSCLQLELDYEKKCEREYEI